MINKHFAAAIILVWRAKGSPIPTPHSMKQQVIRDFAQRYGIKCLVETGTYRGDMVDAMKDQFEAIHSVEVYEPLFTAARVQFARFPHIHIHLGNSADAFVSLLPTLQGPALFWLDGHYSGDGTGGGTNDAPVMGELRQIAATGYRHVILIDDAREFTGTNGYPTLDQVKHWALSQGYRSIEVIDDIVKICPDRNPEVGTSRVN